MPKYLSRASYTSSGVQGLLKDGGTKRRQAIEQLITAGGGSLEAVYWAFGEDDVIVIWEAPSNVDIAAVSLSVGASGVVNISTTVLLTAEEIDEAAKKAVDYSPPGT